MTWLTSIETELGIVKVDINQVIAKIIGGIELAAHELDALFQWGLSQTNSIASALNAVTPIISAVAGLATTAATGNPAAGKIVASAIADVDLAFAGAQKAVQAMQAANLALAASQAAGNGALVNDTSALAAGVQAIAGANSTVAHVTTAALNAAATIQALLPAPTPAAAPAPATA